MSVRERGNQSHRFTDTRDALRLRIGLGRRGAGVVKTDDVIGWAHLLQGFSGISARDSTGSRLFRAENKVAGTSSAVQLDDCGSTASPTGPMTRLDMRGDQKNFSGESRLENPSLLECEAETQICPFLSIRPQCSVRSHLAATRHTFPQWNETGQGRTSGERVVHVPLRPDAEAGHLLASWYRRSRTRCHPTMRPARAGATSDQRGKVARNTDA